MRFMVPGLIACALVLAASQPASPACGDSPGDAQAVAETRAAAEVRCDGAGAADHGQYVRCVAQVANQAARAGQLPRSCRGAVARCAAHSTCGRQGAVACCRTDEKGASKCRIVQDAARCTARAGVSACVSDHASCCDACPGGGCAPPTTTTTLPGAECQSDLECDDQNPCSGDACVDGRCAHVCECDAPGGGVTCCPGPLAECCFTDAQCDDGNPCSGDRCTEGACSHECLCVGPGGSFTCCPGPAAECNPPTTWFYTCGDPVCPAASSPHPGVPACTESQTAETACTPEGTQCDPGDPCNRLLLCATSDPTHGGACPISRRHYKENVSYLEERDLRRLHDELMRFRLATYRYKAPAAASRTHLGFIIDDVEPSLSIDPGGDMVDLYGYTSMAVAALQTQAREIEELKREVALLRRHLESSGRLQAECTR
jgi:hypothetical protein